MLWSIKPLWPCGLQRRVTDGTMADTDGTMAGTDSTMAGTEAVQRATALIEQRLAQEEENEVRAGVQGPQGVLRRTSSTVKGKKSSDATPVVGKRTGVPRGPTGSIATTGYSWGMRLLAVGD